MNPNQRVIDQFEKARLYVITCPPKAGASGYEAMVKAACEGGADVVQLRDKLMTGKERYALAARLKRICRDHGTLFIVNDYLEVAIGVEADGVHLGQDDMPVEEAKRLMHPMGIKNFLVGCSTHSLAQALEAEKQGADYIGIGPVFATPTKPTYQPVGLDLVRQVVPRITIPHVAIGGIDATNMDQVFAAGAKRVAVVRAACGAEDIKKATQRLKSSLRPGPTDQFSSVSGPGPETFYVAPLDQVQSR